jgi:hypothetical protein
MTDAFGHKCTLVSRQYRINLGQLKVKKILGLLRAGLWVTETRPVWSHKAYEMENFNHCRLGNLKNLLPSLWQLKIFYCHKFDFGCKLAVIKNNSSSVVWQLNFFSIATCL